MCYHLFAFLFLCLFTVNVQAQAPPYIHNPVINKDFPDPTIVPFNGKYYAYATNSTVHGKLAHIQVAVSENLQDWTILGDALPTRPTWADHDFWAPHVLFDEDLNKYVLFYSGESGKGKCLGVAYASKPEGPFIDMGKPLLCGEGFVNIDPMAFVDPKSKTKLLYWGSGHQAIKVQEMKNDWSGFKEGSQSKEIMLPRQEGKYDNLIEGAWIDFHEGYYYLYYSGDNCCGTTASYAVLVARAKHPMGPFQRLGADQPSNSSAILEKDSAWLAPGHNSIFRDQTGHAYIAYHAIPINKKTGKPDAYGRVALIKPIVYKSGWPMVVDSTEHDKADTITLADPTIFFDKGTYYLYGTGVKDGFPVYISSDLKTWQRPVGTKEGYALHKRDAFGTSGFWAPQVFKHKDKFFMIYTANEQIAIAESDSPLGPFKQAEKKALNGDTKQIDPYVFFDGGKAYLYFVKLKEGNRLYVAELSANLQQIKEETITPCLQAVEPWENTANADWPVTEGPTVVKHKNLYYLLYSANDFRNPDYAVGYATAMSPLGPWKKNSTNPIISKTHLGLNGTGHGDLFTDDKGNLQYVFHTHSSKDTVSPRKTVLVKLQFIQQGKEDHLKLASKKVVFLTIDGQ